MLLAEFEPGITGLVVAQNPKIIEAMHALQAGVQLADRAFPARLEAATPFPLMWT